MRGTRVTSKQIDRWRSDGLLPPPSLSGSGRARGVRRPAPAGSAQQMVRLVQLLAEARSLHRAAFWLWVEDYPISMERLRRALPHLIPNPKRLSVLSSDELRQMAQAFTERLRRAKGVQPHVKHMLDDEAPTLFETMLLTALGRPVPKADEHLLGALYEKFSGLDRARVDHWEGQQPWLTGDTVASLQDAAVMLSSINEDFASSASDDELLHAREAFRSLMLLRQCAQLLEQVHGQNVFGFGSLTHSPVGTPITMSDPGVLLALVQIDRTNPELITGMIENGKTLASSLESMRQQIEQHEKQMKT